MQNRNLIIYIGYLGIVCLLILGGCKRKYTPKPRGFYRIDLPEKEYQNLNSKYPYSFDFPVYATISDDTSRLAEEYWINILYPDLNGAIHISYKNIDDNINQIIEDTRSLAYKHTVKADAISERMFIKPGKKVYGILYEIEGNAASSVQFFLTDSIKHYLRGALYFKVQPNKDSLAPIIDFVKEDILVLIESFEWN